MKKKNFNPDVGDWIVNNGSTYIVTAVNAKYMRDDDSDVYDLSLKNVVTGWHFQASGVELRDDDSVTWAYSNQGVFIDPVNRKDVDAPLFSLPDEKVLEYLIMKLKRYARIQAETEYWFTQVICATDEIEKRRSDGFYKMMLADRIREKHKTRNSLLTDDKAALYPDRFNHLWNKAVTVANCYAIYRAMAMREANGIFEKSGLVEYRLLEEEE